MKKVFKAALVAAMVIVSASANAQSINVGYVSTKAADSDGDAVSGITAGIGYDMEVQGLIGLSWGLNYTYSWESADHVKFTDNHLDVPVRLTFGVPVTDNVKVFGFAGPKFVYAIAGSTKYDTDGIEDMKRYGENSPVSRFDIKAGAGAGIQFNNIVLKAGYDWGLLNQNKWHGSNDLDKIFFKDIVSKTNQFYVTLGFAF